jgi:hypothetical protein
MKNEIVGSDKIIVYSLFLIVVFRIIALFVELIV